MTWTRPACVLALNLAIGALALATAQPPARPKEATKPDSTKTAAQAEKAAQERARKIVDERKAMIGRPAPEFYPSATINARNQRLADFRGKVVLLNFWTVGSSPSLTMLPFLKELSTKYKERGLEVIGLTGYVKNRDFKDGSIITSPVNLTPPQEQDMLRRLAAHLQLKYRLALLNDDVRKDTFSEYKVGDLPHFVIIDRYGVLRLMRIGEGSENARVIEAELQKVLDEPHTAIK